MLSLAQAVVVFVVGYGAGVLAHEAGHAVASWALGMQPRLVTLGIGPPRVRMRLGRMWVVLRGWPNSGSVASLSSLRRRPAADAVLYLAGAGTNLALAAALVLAAPDDPDLRAVLEVLTLSQLWLAARSLLPVRCFGQTNDMLILIGLLRHPQDMVGECHTHVLAMTGPPTGPWSPPALPSPAMPEIAYQWSRRERHTEDWVRRDVADVMRGLLRAGRLPVAERAFVLGFLATTELTCDGPGASLAEMDGWSAEAVALSPTPTLQVTRGCVLVLLDRRAEARAMLLGALPGPLRLSEDALARAYLAMLDGAEGDLAGAGAWLAQVYALGEQAGLQRLLPRLARLAGPWGPPPPGGKIDVRPR